jgi:fructosamine-3-kinase
MDVWSENILVDECSAVTGLIDWDRALWGDPEIEYAVLDYCGISEPAFWEGYRKERDLSTEARIRQVFYLLYELQKYIIIRQGRGNDSARAKQYKQQVFDTLSRSGIK